ncbi:hypothetical protein [Candidatus Electronema sp. PJ]
MVKPVEQHFGQKTKQCCSVTKEYGLAGKEFSSARKECEQLCNV